MSPTPPQLLLVGKDANGASSLAGKLRGWGCRCDVASSCGEVCRLLNLRQFDVVLCEIDLPDGRGYRLIPLLLESQSSLFFSLPVEDGCWWLPAIVRGRHCFGSRALRPDEFARELRQLLGLTTRKSSSLGSAA